MKRTRARKKRTGSSGAIVVAAAALLMGVCVAFAGSEAKKQETAYALVAGTVFRETGVSLPGAEVSIETVAAESSKPRKWKAVTDGRGEFAVRLPVGQASYKVTARAPGCESEEKVVQTTGEDRVDVFFRLAPASKRMERQ